jgi:hypothetical protein
MQKILNRLPETETTLLPAPEAPPFLKLAAARAHHKLRIVLPPMPRREACLTDRKCLAARRMMEFVLWQASGGDFLHSARAAEFIRLAQQI